MEMFTIAILALMLGHSDSARPQEKDANAVSLSVHKGYFQAAKGVAGESALKSVLNEKNMERRILDPIPLEETNVAMIGSDEDHAARKKAAEKEPAWAAAKGMKNGIMVWQVLGVQPSPGGEVAVLPPGASSYEPNAFAKFLDGDAYIVLVAKTEEEETTRDIYFWLGSRVASGLEFMDKRFIAAYKCVELDELFDGEASQHRVVMGSEPEGFKALFGNQVQVAEGGSPSGLHHVKSRKRALKFFKLSPQWDPKHPDKLLKDGQAFKDLKRELVACTGTKRSRKNGRTCSSPDDFAESVKTALAKQHTEDDACYVFAGGSLGKIYVYYGDRFPIQKQIDATTLVTRIRNKLLSYLENPEDRYMKGPPFYPQITKVSREEFLEAIGVSDMLPGPLGESGSASELG